MIAIWQSWEIVSIFIVIIISLVGLSRITSDFYIGNNTPVALRWAGRVFSSSKLII